MSNHRSIKSIPFERFIDKVVAALDDHTHPHSAAFTLLLGSGFSHPLIPTATEMVQRDIPWWLSRRKDKALAQTPFTNAPNNDPALDQFAQSLWTKINAEPPHADKPIELVNGLPKSGGDNISVAYQAIMSGQYSVGLNTPQLQRAYLRDVIQRVGNRINLAHIYLASIFASQSQKKFNRPFCRTVFTTNFDPLLQRALQLYNQLYFMTDRPEDGIEPPDDDTDSAIHLIYTHGSIHRYRLANTNATIQQYEEQNASALSNYFGRHGVIVMGYGGWTDTTMKALQDCRTFDGNLYWCGRGALDNTETGGLPKNVADLLSQNPDSRFYVQLPSGGADAAMSMLHEKLGLGRAPSFVFDPIEGLIRELDCIQLPNLPALPTKQATQSGSDLHRPESAGISSLGSIKDALDRTLGILRQVQTEYFEHSSTNNITQPTSPPDDKRIHIDALMNQAFRAWLDNKYSAAIDLLSQVITSPDAPAEQKAKALVTRGVTKLQAGDTAGEIADYHAVLAMHDAPAEQKAKAHFNIGCHEAEQKHVAEAIAALERWRAMNPQANQKQLDDDSDFDLVRDDPLFVAFHTSLPTA